MDNCCFNRPFDDQSNIRIRLETEAKLYIQEKIINKEIELYELHINKLKCKRDEILFIRVHDHMQIDYSWKHLLCDIWWLIFILMMQCIVILYEFDLSPDNTDI